MPYNLQGSLTRTGAGTPLYQPEGTVDGVSSVSAGTGISLTGTASAPIVNNAGVLSVAAADASITVGGTAANPTLAVAGLASPSQTSYTSTFFATATGPLGNALSATIPVVPGGVYALSSGQMVVDAFLNGGSQFGFTVFLNNGANDVPILNAPTNDYVAGGKFAGTGFQLGSVVFVAAGSTVSIGIANTNLADAGATSQFTIASLELTRIR